MINRLINEVIEHLKKTEDRTLVQKELYTFGSEFMNIECDSKLIYSLFLNSEFILTHYKTFQNSDKVSDKAWSFFKYYNPDWAGSPIGLYFYHHDYNTTNWHIVCIPFTRIPSITPSEFAVSDFIKEFE